MGWKDDPVVGPAARAPQGGGRGWQSDPVVGPARTPAKLKADQGLGFVKGVEKPIDNLAMWLEGGAKHLGIDTDAVNRFVGLPSASEARDQHAAAVERKRAEGVRPGRIGEVAGNIVGTAPALFEGPLVAGAMQGAALTDHPDDVGRVALDAAGGAALNKTVGVGVDKFGAALSPVISPAVQTLEKYGVKLTPGLRKGGAALEREEERLTKPVVGRVVARDREAALDSNSRGAINRALFPLGIRLPDNVPSGHEATAWMQQQAGDAYDRILPNLGLKADGRLAVGMRRAQMIAQQLPKDQQEAFLNIVRTNLDFNSQGGLLSGRQLTRGLRDLRTRAAGYGRSSMEAERQLGAALGEVTSGVDSALMAQNPKFAPQLKAANSAYRDSQVINRASAASDDGIPTTAQYKTASKAVDRSKNKRMTAAGIGPMQDYTKAAREVIPRPPPPSAGRGGSLKGRAAGLLDQFGYQAEKALSGLVPPAQAKQLAGLLAQYKAPMSAIGGPVVGGLLSGLFANE